MFSNVNAANIFDSLLTAAKSARDTFYLVSGTGPLEVHIRHSHESMNEQKNIQETMKEFAEDLKAEETANNSIFLSEEFADVQSIVKDTNEIFKELKKLMQQCHTLIPKAIAECKSPSEISEKIESVMDQLNESTRKYKENVERYENQINETLKAMLKSSSTSWQKTAAYLVVAACGEIALLTMGCAAILMAAATAAKSVVTLNPMGLVGAATATAAILTGMAASLAAVPVVVGVAVVNRMKPAAPAPGK